MWKVYLPTNRKKTSDMEAIIFTLINVLCAAFIWFRIGRQRAFDKILHDYMEMVKVCQTQQLIIKTYEQEYGELTDGTNEEN